VPDAELLIRLAEILEVPVSTLLGAAVPNEKEPDDIARQLSHINEQLAVKNRRSRRIWRTAAAVLIAVVVIYLLLIAVNIIAFNKFRVDDPGRVQVTDYVEVMPEKQK
jgi:transcriptional regulator with XRE-family HTH domain